MHSVWKTTRHTSYAELKRGGSKINSVFCENFHGSDNYICQDTQSAIITCSRGSTVRIETVGVKVRISGSGRTSFSGFLLYTTS